MVGYAMSPQTTMCMHVTFAPRIQSPKSKYVSTPQWCNFVYQLYTVHRPTSEIGIDVDINHFTSKCTN